MEGKNLIPAHLYFENKSLILMIYMKFMNFLLQMNTLVKFSLEFDKCVAPTKGVMKGKISLELSKQAARLLVTQE